jgi:PhzF family phenazine biosynthesis protein
MTIELHQVDAFTDRPFAGNPAAVCFPDAAVDEAWLQRVAAEMNLSETAFLWPAGDAWRLRWLTPKVEVDLCGHATLAASHVLWDTGRLAKDEVARFHTRSGELRAARLADGRIELDFPATPPRPEDAPSGLLPALGLERADVLETRFDYLVVVDAEAIVRGLAPDYRALRGLGVRGVIVSARAETAGLDIVSRFFAPGAGVDEDPVTGSAHCALAPYWSGRLGRTVLSAYQASPRGGALELELRGDRVALRGHAVTVLRGHLTC